MRIAWLIDVQAPYREPMYAELAKLSKFSAHFFFGEEKVRHWVWHDDPRYRSSVVGSVRIPLPRFVLDRLDTPLAVLRPGVTGRMLATADVVGMPSWAQPVYLWTALRARLRGIPYILYSESTLDSRRFHAGPINAVRSWVFRHAGAVVVPGPSARKAAVVNGVAPDRIVESVNSIDLDTFGQRPRELRRDIPDGKGAHRFAYIGQLIPRKNVAALVEAFAALDGKPTLDVAGDGVEMPALEALVAEQRVADRVRFHGFLDEPGVVELLARTYTLVLPSTEEVYGMTALEAHVAGLQVVVSNVAGIAANLADARGVWLVDPSVGGIAKGLDAARHEWAGWADDVTVEVASPRRTAEDVVRAAEIALGGAPAP